MYKYLSLVNFKAYESMPRESYIVFVSGSCTFEKL